MISERGFISRRATIALSGLLVVSGVVVVVGGRQAELRALRLLDEAQSVLDDARREGLQKVNPPEFAAARDLVIETQRALEDRHRWRAAWLASKALAATLSADELARKLRVTPRAGTFGEIHRQVLYRPGSALAWEDAVLGGSLFDGDRVATKKHAWATIHFQGGNELRVLEDSVVVIKRLVEDRANSIIDMEIEVSAGRVQSIVERIGSRNVRLQMRLPEGDIVVDTGRSGDERIELGTEIRDDQSTRITVYSGRAVVETLEGEKRELKKDEFTDVSARGLSETRALLPLAVAIYPRGGDLVHVNPRQDLVTFRWRQPEGCVRAHVEVVGEAELGHKLVDDETQRTRLSATLPAGSYTWRLSCIGSDGERGAYAGPFAFEVVHHSRAPELDIITPASNAVLTEQRIEARCRTRGPAAVFVNGEEARPVGDGEYARSIELGPGLNSIVFEVVDLSGNASRARRFVMRSGG